MDQAKNFAKVAVDGGYDASATEVDVIFTASNPLPTPPFNVVWWNATDYPDPADDPGVEIVRVTAQDDVTLTITRAQEGTSAQDHNVAGKTYKMIACLTAHVINEDVVGDLFGGGPALVYDPAGPAIKLRYDDLGVRFIQLDGNEIEIQSTLADLGDFEGQGNNGYVRVDDTNSRAILNNLDLCTTQSVSATGPVGTVVGKLAIRDAGGTLLGYLPIYNSIT